MGVHYGKLNSAVNSPVRLRGTVPYGQKIIIARLIVAGGNCTDFILFDLNGSRTIGITPVPVPYSSTRVLEHSSTTL